MKKKILIVVIIAVLLLIGVGVFIVSNSIAQQFKLRQEIAEINLLVNETNIDYEAINKKLDETVSKGNYAIVEETAKQYMSDTLGYITKITEILQDEQMSKILSAENYKQDMPEFVNTKTYIEQTKTQLEDNKNALLEMFTEEKVMSYIEQKNISKYYNDLYKELAFEGESIDDKDIKTIEDSIDTVIKMLDQSNKIIDFLIANNGKWSIRGSSVLFDSQALANEYNNLISEL